MKKFLFLFIILWLLLIFHSNVISGAKEGLLLWYQILIPSLLPFILVTNALSETNSYQMLAYSIKKICSHHSYEILAIFFGNLCGYPIGGKIINDFIQTEYISQKRGMEILALSSQASPMFLIGYVYLQFIQSQIPLWIFLISIYLPVFLYYLFQMKETSPLPCLKKQRVNTFILNNTFLNSVHSMVIIGIYVMIFSILISILLPFCKSNYSRIFLSFFEITNGLQLINTLFLPEKIKIATLCFLSSFGGLCSAYQIKSVSTSFNWNIKKYLYDKFILSTGTFIIIFLYLTIQI